MDDTDELVEKFTKAAKYAKEICGEFDSNELLELYGYYKQATEGPCQTSKPSWYDLTAKQKWESWRRLKDMDRETAMIKYVKIISEVDPVWEERFTERPAGSGAGWVAVSCMTNTDEYLPDTEKTVFDWVKEGNVQKVIDASRSFSSLEMINKQDEGGMALLHWAADRGNMEMVDCLVEKLKADVNLKDADGQTALHYAAACGHVNVTKFLVQHGGDPNIADLDGKLPKDIAADSEILKTLTIAN
ncbi:acyl-CoA-binding domain-containing protein 6-like [Schistocerca cancellata]|uniref:acyl-CoA-binding domain-containing protein 6-like n=1 Tax=Schistocerca cancellata TaxID=274614 RepID=UPI0021176AC2|nr:acyl-CoA-binding domain-containing protein 6-like [Schistocerca cancellata]